MSEGDKEVPLEQATEKANDVQPKWEARSPADRGHFIFDLPPDHRVSKIEGIPVSK